MSKILPESQEINSNTIPELTLEEHNRAQLELMGLVGMDKDNKSRALCIDENSDPFDRLEEDPEVRRLIRGRNFEEVKCRLEALKLERK